MPGRRLAAAWGNVAVTNTSFPPPPRMPRFCDACGGLLTESLARVLDPQTREAFGIAVCAQCGLGETFPRPEDLARYYGSAYHGGRHGVTASYCVRRRTRFVRHIAGAACGRRLLDVGCGDGSFLLAARRQGWDVSGTEMAPSIARAAGLQVWAELEEAAAQAPFACVTLWHSLEHMRAPRETIALGARLLEPGGSMLVAVPNAEGLQAVLFGSKWFHRDVPRHLFHFGRRSLSRVLEDAGLAITRCYHLEIELDLFGWTQSALNSIFSEPNIFFHQLTGRSSAAGAITKSANFVMGTLLTAVACPLAAAGALLARGAILIMAARKPAVGVG